MSPVNLDFPVKDERSILPYRAFFRLLVVATRSILGMKVKFGVLKEYILV